MTIGYATPEVAIIRLVNDQRTWTTPLGVDGFFLLGTTVHEPTTRASAIGHDGKDIPGDPIVL